MTGEAADSFAAGIAASFAGLAACRTERHSTAQGERARAPQTRFEPGSSKESAALRARERSFAELGAPKAKQQRTFDAFPNMAFGEGEDPTSEGSDCGHADAPRVGQGRWPWEPGFTPEIGLGGARPNRPRHAMDKEVDKYLDWATAKGDRGRALTGTKLWKQFCASIGEPAERPLDASAPTWVKLEEEMLCMKFVCALVEIKGLEPTTARAYFGHAQTWHNGLHGVKFAGGLNFTRLPMMMKGMKRLIPCKEHKIRRGIAPQMLREAMDKCLDPKVPAHANLRAALALALQGLLRSAEFTVKKASQWKTKLNLARSDVKRLDAKMLVMMMHPCKNMIHRGGKTCPLVIGAGGEYIDAVAEMRNMFEVDAARGEDTPLFRDPATGKALEYDVVLALIKSLLVSIGENPAEFGTHSLRIGGATALFAAGANPTVIRTMGRWSSDLYRLYVRASFEQAVAWSRRTGSTSVHEIAGIKDFDEVDDY